MMMRGKEKQSEGQRQRERNKLRKRNESESRKTPGGRSMSHMDQGHLHFESHKVVLPFICALVLIASHKHKQS